jgi:hypothetical protein
MAYLGYSRKPTKLRKTLIIFFVFFALRLPPGNRSTLLISSYLSDASFICFGSHAEALRYSYPVNSGEFPQIRAFPPDHRKLCLIDFLKAKYT